MGPDDSAEWDGIIEAGLGLFLELAEYTMGRLKMGARQIVIPLTLGYI